MPEIGTYDYCGWPKKRKPPPPKSCNHCFRRPKKCACKVSR